MFKYNVHKNHSLKTDGLKSQLFLKLSLGLLLAINLSSATSLAVIADASAPPPKLDPVTVECREIGYRSTLNYGWIYWKPISKEFNGFYSLVDEATLNRESLYPEYKGKYCPNGSSTRQLTECIFTFEAYDQEPNGNFGQEKKKITFDFNKHKLIISNSKNGYNDKVETELPESCNSLADSFSNRERSLNQLFPRE